MIQEKTKGNLNKDEAQILANALSNLQIAFVEAAREQRSERKTDTAPLSAEPQPESKIETPTTETPAVSEREGKKKFVKSYGS